MNGPRPVVDAALLARHLSGESSRAEAARVREWLRADPAHEVELEDLRRAWAIAARTEPPIDTAVAWGRVLERIRSAGAAAAPRASAAPVPAPAHRPVWRGTLLPPARRGVPPALIAAGIAVAAAALLFIRGAPSPAPAPEYKLSEYATGPGQRAIVELADGTRISLAPESRLRLRQPVGARGTRDAYLTGEAVFTVKHDTARAFLVHAKGAVTIDVGTRFGVRAYPGAPLRVAVAEGRVAFADDSALPAAAGEPLVRDGTIATLPHATMLSAGDVVSRADDGTETVSRGVDADALLGWSTGRLAFDHVRLADLIPDLQRWYGLTVRVAQPSLLRERVSGAFETESLDEIVRALERALGARASRRGGTVTFTR